MKKVLLSILAVLMLVRAEPVQALSWIDYASNITTTLFTRASNASVSQLAGGAFIAFCLVSVYLLKNDKLESKEKKQIPGSPKVKKYTPEQDKPVDKRLINRPPMHA
jgi:hypothetical protein